MTDFYVAVLANDATKANDQFEPLAAIASGDVELRHPDCAGGKCVLEESTYKGRSGETYPGFRLRCTICGETSKTVSGGTIIQGGRCAALKGETHNYGGWVEFAPFKG